MTATARSGVSSGLWGQESSMGLSTGLGKGSVEKGLKWAWPE